MKGSFIGISLLLVCTILMLGKIAYAVETTEDVAIRLEFNPALHRLRNEAVYFGLNLENALSNRIDNLYVRNDPHRAYKYERKLKNTLQEIDDEVETFLQMIDLDVLRRGRYFDQQKATRKEKEKFIKEAYRQAQRGIYNVLDRFSYRIY